MKTVKESKEMHYIIQKSEFISCLYPISSFEEGLEILQSVRKKYYDATHHCSAMILGDNGENARNSDDGEPSRTAGVPIMEILKKNQITNCICVVTRYFGGIKLGAGGLIRAYSEACKEAILGASFQEKKYLYHWMVNIPYDAIGYFERFFRTNQIQIKNTIYQDTVTYEILFFPELEDDLKIQLRDQTKGKEKIEILEQEILYVPCE